MSFDINSLQLQDTTTLHLKNPSTEMPLYTGEKHDKPVEIVIYGRSSKQYRQWLSAAESAKARRKNKEQSPEEKLADTVDFLAAITKEVRNIKIGDTEVNNYEAIKAMYAAPGLVWIGDQVANALSEVDGFLQS